MKRLLLSILMALSVEVAVPARTSAQELNALEQALRCRQAGDQAIALIENSTDGAGYQKALADLSTTVDGFVAKTGELEESSLHCLNYEGATLMTLGEYGRAAEVYRRAVASARKNFGPDDDSTLTLQGNLAVALMHVGSLQEAADLEEDTLARRENLAGTPKAHKLAFTLINLAMIESARGEVTKARELADRGWQISQTAVPADDPRWATILDSYAMVLDQSGSRSRAQEFYEKALAKRLEARDKQGAVESLASLAASYYDMGRVEESDARYREAYGLAREAFPPLHPTRGQISRNWCRVLSSISKLEESLKQCDEALQIESAHGEEDKLQVLLTEVNRGVTLGEMESYPEAIESLNRALTGLRTNFPNYSLEILEAVRSLGVVLVDAGQIPEGAALLSEALGKETAALGEMHPDVLQTQGNYGVVLAMEGKFSESEAVLTDYAKKSDLIRPLYGREERTMRGVFSRYASTRMFLAKVLINQGRCREAFDWIEETKARSLRDQIQEHAAFGEASEQDRELFVSLNESRNRLYIERAQAAGDGGKESAIDSRLQSVDGKIQALLNKAHDRESTVTSSATASSAVQQRIKGADAIAVAFGLVEQEVLIVSYGAKSDFQCTSLGDWQGLYETLWATHALESNLTGMAGLLAGGYGVPPSRIVRSGSRTFRLITRADSIPKGFTIEPSATKMLSDVGKELLGWPLSKAGSAHRIVFSPDGLLGIVALDALPVNGDPLIARVSVSQVDSFAPLARNAQGSQNPKKPYAISMVALGNPVYETGEPAQTAAMAIQKARLVLRGDNDQSSTWPALPASGVELRGLTTLYQLEPGKTVFAREKATVKNLEALNANGTLMETRFLVFSAHAFADVSDPELSSIVLSRPPNSGPRDSYFTATQLSSLRLNSDLVFFSACETGFGQVVTGEGVVSLSSAAMAAGAHATVNTLWSIPDATSADFTKQFFGALRRGRSSEEALTETKRAFLHDPAHASIAYWAPYVLIQR